MLLNFHQASTIYVSQTHGSDEMGVNGFSPLPDAYGNGPVKTVERAMRDISELRAVGDLRPMTVAFTEDYFIDAPITIGLNGNSYVDGNMFPLSGITFTSFGEKKRLIGGFPVSGWVHDSFNGHDCLSAFLPEEHRKAVFTDLYVNGVPASPTRYPEGEKTFTVLDTENNSDAALFSPSSWFIARKKDLAGLSDIENATVNYYHYWIDEHSPVSAYDARTGRIDMALPSRFAITTRYAPVEATSALHYYFEHIPQGFTRPGQWYLDRNAGKVYYMPTDPTCDPSSLEVYAPSTPALFRIEGSREVPIKDIHITDLDLLCTKNEYAASSDMGTHESGVETHYFASDAQSVCGGSGALSFDYAKDCSVENCSLSCMGVYSIGINPGCRAIRVENNLITRMAAGGVRITGGSANAPEEDRTDFCVVRGNTITHLGLRYAAGCGVLIIHASHNEVSENEIAWLDYTGISVGFVWGYRANMAFGNLIRRNHIHHVGMGRLSDMGGIYLLGHQPGTRVEYNRIHDVNSNHYGGWGIYTDEGSQDLLIRGNVVYNTKCEGYHQHYGARNMVVNNIFAFGGLGSLRVSRGELHDTILFERNLFIQKGKPFMDPVHVSVGGHNVTLRTASLQKNIFFDLKGEGQLPTPDGLQNAGEVLSHLGIGGNSFVADPGVTDIGHYDFTPLPGSKAEELGFSPENGIPYRPMKESL